MKIENRERLISVEIIRFIVVVYFLFFQNLVAVVPILKPANIGALTTNQKLIFLPFVFFGSLIGIFPFLFGVTTSWTFSKNILNKKSNRRFFLIGGILLLFFLFLDLLRAYLFQGRDPLPFTGNAGGSIITLSIQTGMFIFPPIEQLYRSGILFSIVLTTFISIFLLFLLIKFAKQDSFFNILILSILGIVMIVLVNTNLPPFFDFSKELFFRGGMNKVWAYILYIFWGRDISIVTMFVYSLFGVIFGYRLSLPGLEKSFNPFSLFFILLFSGIFIFLFGTDYIASHLSEGGSLLNSFYSYRNNRLLTLGSLILFFTVMLFMIRYFDGFSLKERYSISGGSYPFRVIGSLLLSIYIVEPSVTEFFSGIRENRLAIFIDTPFPVISEPYSSILFVLFSTLFWITLFWIWSRFNFRGRIETLFFLFISIFYKRKVNSDYGNAENFFYYGRDS